MFQRFGYSNFFTVKMVVFVPLVLDQNEQSDKQNLFDSNFHSSYKPLFTRTLEICLQP